MIWLKPAAGTATRVDIHHTLNNGAQQSLRMTLTPRAARYERKVLAPVATDHVPRYRFTGY